MDGINASFMAAAVAAGRPALLQPEHGIGDAAVAARTAPTHRCGPNPDQPTYPPL